MEAVPRWWKAILVLAVLLLLGGSIWYYRMQRQHYFDETIASLETISQLKINQITAWRSALMREAIAMMRSPYYINLANRWQNGPRAEDIDGIYSRLRTAREYYFYDEVFYAGVDEKVHLTLNNSSSTLPDAARQAMREAFGTGKPVMTDLYLWPNIPSPQVAVVLPFYDGTTNPPVPNSALIFQYDTQQSLYPIIQFWPVPSRTAETLLVRRDGDSVLFLHELRHKKGGAMTLRIPLDRNDVASVQAVLGRRGIVQGEDYRNVKVISVANSVPDTHWLMIAQMDEREAFSELQRVSVLILAGLLFLIGLISTALGVMWQRNEKAHYRTLFEMEAAQRKSEALYRNALDGIKEGCQIIGFDWHHIYLNATALKHSGRTKEELIKTSLMEAFPGIENTELFAAFRRCMDERTSHQIISSSKDLNGELRWLETSIQPISEGIFVLINDITERKRAEESLRESEEQYRMLFDHMIQGAFRVRTDGSIMDVNPAALRVFGLSKEEFLNNAYADSMRNLIREDGTTLSRAETPEMLALKTGIPTSDVVGLWNPQIKKAFWIEFTAIPEFLEGCNTPYQVLVTLHDISERKQAESDHDRLALAIDQSSECVVIIGPDRIVQYVNPVFEKTAGKKREEAIGHPLPITEHQDEAFYRNFWSVLESGKTWKGRLINYTNDGTQYTEEATVSPVFNGAGVIVNYVSIARNITEVLRLQEEKEKLQEQFLQAQKMESIGRLAGGVAHDFNNMLNVISGYAQLSLDVTDPSHPLYFNLQEIKKAAQRSTDLTRQLLAFARRQTIAPRVLDLNSTIAGLLSMLQRLIGEEIGLVWMPGRNLWSVRIDPTQIDQILANLAVNARDAIDQQGKITIETANVTVDEDYCVHHLSFVPGKYVMLAISDDGCGMDKDVLEHLFEPFFTTKKIGKGTGLGLATVYGIVKQNEGFVNVYSEPGRGSTLKIYLPRYVSAESTGTTEIAVETSSGGVETILLVEDEEAVLNLAKKMLERLGYKVFAATTPTEAIRFAKEYPDEIQGLLVDVVMPEMTGRELAEQLTLLRPRLKTLFMSGYTANVIAHRGVLDEGVVFIQKPFSSADLAAKIREVLEPIR
jgi:two-component system, cell cycle sensor histidine kinase and response regulator CckA